jgi:hypothetical protein
MNESAEEELSEFTRLKHLTWIEKSTPWLIFFVSGPGSRRCKFLLPPPWLVFLARWKIKRKGFCRWDKTLAPLKTAQPQNAPPIFSSVD